MRALLRFKNAFIKGNPALPQRVIDDFELICPFNAPLILAIKDIFIGFPVPVSTHYHYVKDLWYQAKKVGFRNYRCIEIIKRTIDSFKKFPFDQEKYLKDNDKIGKMKENTFKDFGKSSAVSNKINEFYRLIQSRLLLDNKKSEEFDCFPFRFWNLSDRWRKKQAFIKKQNIGAEFFNFIMQEYFDDSNLKNFDIKTVVEKLKLMEQECYQIYSNAGKQAKLNQTTIKYKFFPIETNQMTFFQEFKKEKEKDKLEDKNIIPLSDDEDEKLRSHIKQLNLEEQRICNKFMLHQEIKSDDEDTRSRSFQQREIPSTIRQTVASNVPQQYQQEPQKLNLQQIFEKCGLNETYIQKLEEQQINAENISLLKSEEFIQMGLPLGPAKLLHKLVQDHSQKQTHQQRPAFTNNFYNKGSQSFDRSNYQKRPFNQYSNSLYQKPYSNDAVADKAEEESIFKELRETAGKPVKKAEVQQGESKKRDEKASSKIATNNVYNNLEEKVNVDDMETSCPSDLSQHSLID
ncbi:hypothetical protein FGO68_gene16161 [Halteria grandinella]|uniref:SAM domain-containing protein n=1 Tax=Halteria grandinella TaxID=5974 RepID=A0A8J8NXT3_HALGN|nr:hypothetical protein FGO68_gene16161 [Halteria grandinella]